MNRANEHAEIITYYPNTTHPHSTQTISLVDKNSAAEQNPKYIETCSVYL